MLTLYLAHPKSVKPIKRAPTSRDSSAGSSAQPPSVHTHTIDFHDPSAVQALNHVLLLHDFALGVRFRANRLCPPVPGRLDYLLWLRDLLREADAVRALLARCLERPVSPDKSGALDGAARADASEGDRDDSSERTTKRRRLDPPSETDRPKLRRNQLLLDIGTGSVAIYPLLGCALTSAASDSDAGSPTWHFVGTDVDAVSLAHARTQLAGCEADGAGPNSRLIKERIALVQRAQSDRLIPALSELEADTDAQQVLRRCDRSGAVRATGTPPVSATSDGGDGGDVFDATLCNPPFYSSSADIAQRAAGKAQRPHAVCSGNESEMITAGGEVAFVRRMIDDSLPLSPSPGQGSGAVGEEASTSSGTSAPAAGANLHSAPSRSASAPPTAYHSRRTWYTCLLGLRASVDALAAHLQQRGVANWLTTEQRQGDTTRWLLAWSFGSVHVEGHHRGKDETPSAGKAPRAAQLVRTLDFARTSAAQRPIAEQLAELLRRTPGCAFTPLDSVESEPLVSQVIPSGEARAQSKRWVATFRTNSWNRAARRNAQATARDSPTLLDPVLGVLLVLDEQEEATRTQHMHLRWLYGSDHRHFASFCSLVSKSMK